MTNYDVFCSRIFVSPDKYIPIGQVARNISQTADECTRCPLYNAEAKVCKYPGKSCLQKILMWLHEEAKEEEKKMVPEELTTINSNDMYTTDKPYEMAEEPRSLSRGGSNSSGYYEDAEGARFGKLLHAIFQMCDAAGYDVKGRVILKDRKTGRVHQ